MFYPAPGMGSLIGLGLLVAALVSLGFATRQAFEAWHWGVAVAIALLGVGVTLFVPFGAVVAIVGSIVVYRRAGRAVLDGEMSSE